MGGHVAGGLRGSNILHSLLRSYRCGGVQLWFELPPQNLGVGHSTCIYEAAAVAVGTQGAVDVLNRRGCCGQLYFTELCLLLPHGYLSSSLVSAPM